MDKYDFHISIVSLMSNSGLAEIFNDEHIEVAEIYFQRYRNSIANLENNTSALASLISVRDYAISKSLEKKKEFKSYLKLHVKRSKFVKNKEDNEKLVSTLVELIEEESLPSDVITANQFIKSEKNLELIPPKSFHFFYEIIEAAIIGSNFYRLMSTFEIQEHGGIINMDLFYFARRYNRYIYYKLHAAVIEYILDYQFESEVQKLPNNGFKRKLIDINRNIEKIEQPSRGRNESEKTSQERVCEAVDEILNDSKLVKRFLRNSGKLKGTYNLDGISKYLLRNNFKEVENPIGVRMLREKVRICLPKDRVPQKRNNK